MVTSLKLADQTWSSPVKFDNETVVKRFLEPVWNRSVLKVSDKIIFGKQSFQLENNTCHLAHSKKYAN